MSCGMRGLSASSTLAGLPDRITPLGFIRAKASAAELKGTISE